MTIGQRGVVIGDMAHVALTRWGRWYSQKDTKSRRQTLSDAEQAEGGPGGVIVGVGGGGVVVVVESSAASECRQADGRSRRPAGGKVEGDGRRREIIRWEAIEDGQA